MRTYQLALVTEGAVAASAGKQEYDYSCDIGHLRYELLRQTGLTRENLTFSHIDVKNGTFRVHFNQNEPLTEQQRLALRHPWVTECDEVKEDDTEQHETTP